jgi:hypothetical protein
MPEGNFLVRARLVAPFVEDRINHQPSECSLEDTVVLERCIRCVTMPTANEDRVCDNCRMKEADEFGRHSAVFEERLTKDTRPAMDCGIALEATERAMNSDRPVGEVRGCCCGLCRTDWSE